MAVAESMACAWPAMVNLVLEQMHEQAVAPFGLHLRVAIDPHDVVEQGRRQRVADSDQTRVDCSLSPLEFSKRRTWNLVLPGFWPEPSTLERVDVEQIDDVDVVQRSSADWGRSPSASLQIPAGSGVRKPSAAGGSPRRCCRRMRGKSGQDRRASLFRLWRHCRQAFERISTLSYWRFGILVDLR